MCADDLLNDIETQTQSALAPAGRLPATKRIENMVDQIGRDASVVLHAQTDSGRITAIDPDNHSATFGTVLQRIADEVGCNLPQAVGIPIACRIAGADRLDLPIRKRR